MHHLIDLVEAAPDASFIVIGGLGIMLKQAHLIEVGARTLVEVLPEARATADIDLFLRIELLCNDSDIGEFRSTIDKLGYQPHVANWQFQKEFGPGFPDQRLTLDLHSREPSQSENITFDRVRVGHGPIHGRTTPEAFAVDEQPIQIRARSGAREATIQVPHPYAWINMKTRAAHDWLRFARGEVEVRKGRKPPSSKHAFDAVLLVAMLTEEELESCESVRSPYAFQDIASSIRGEAQSLYGTPQSQGWVEAVRQGATSIDHALFWGVLRQVIGLED